MTITHVTELEMALLKEMAELRAELSEYKAARVAYASEFPLDEDGQPDVGSIHQNIRGHLADAMRYRWLRKMDAEQWDYFFGGMRRDCNLTMLDAAIDAAKEKTE